MTPQRYQTIHAKVQAKRAARDAERARRKAELAFMVVVPIEDLIETVKALDGKATLRSWGTDRTDDEVIIHAEHAARHRLCDGKTYDFSEDTHASFLAVFERAEDATLFMMFNEGIATRITDEDWRAYDRWQAERAAEQAEIDAEAERTKDQVNLEDARLEQWIFGRREFEAEDDPTSPRVTIR